jgi:Tol biopolymer transport system component
MARDGTFAPLREVRANYRSVQFSPDGRRLAIGILDAGADVWVYELERKTMSRLTFHESNDFVPIWTRDGTRIVFASNRDGTGSVQIYWKEADGTGEAQRLFESEHQTNVPSDWHPDGNLLAYTVQKPDYDIYILPVDDDASKGLVAGEPEPFLVGPFNEDEPTFSPDGRFIAYASDESGADQIYVRPFPGPGGRWQISTDGGLYPEWSPNGRELYYRSGGGLGLPIMVVRYTVDGDQFKPETPTVWSEARFVQRGDLRNFSVHPDGERFAVLNAEIDVADTAHLTFVFNFFDELERIVPAR